MSEYGLPKESILAMLASGRVSLESDELGYTQVFNNGRLLAQRINKRRRMRDGDPRVDIWSGGKRLSINVSHLVWMQHTNSLLPAGWEIHHRDENPYNNSFSNMLCLHPLDHQKLHARETDKEEVPF